MASQASGAPEPDYDQEELMTAADIRRAADESDEADDRSASDYDETGITNPWAHRFTAADMQEVDDEDLLESALAAL